MLSIPLNGFERYHQYRPRLDLQLSIPLNGFPSKATKKTIFDPEFILSIPLNGF